jgi:guanosine-3',5'-bis(diphosphate) 3'-pyrophosphohydrolase
MNSAEEKIAKVRDFANEAHGEQKRRYSDDPYIVHPMRVMEMCANYTNDIAVLCAAILHDVLEDTAVGEKELSDFLSTVMEPDESARTLTFVIELTDVFIKQTYPRMNRRNRKEREALRLAAVSADAQTIKYADIIDNTDVTGHDPDFAKKYLGEARQLLISMQNGNPQLRDKAIKRVDDCLQSLQSQPLLDSR